MKKLFNYRPVFFGFIVLLCGIYLSVSILKVNIYVNLAFLILAVILILVFCFVKKLASVKGKGIFLLAVFIGSLILGSVTIFSYQNVFKLNKENMTIEGVVTDSINKSGINSKIELRNVVLDGKKYSGNLKLTVFGFENTDSLSAGDRVSFNGCLGVSSLVRMDGSSDYSALYESRKFFASVNGKDMLITEGSPNLFENIRIKTKANIYRFIPNEDFAESCYAVLFGDRTNLNTDISSTFRLAGVAHLLAISGLHIGLLIAILFFILNLFKVRKLPKFFVCATFLLIYCFLAGFSPSVCRAAIMIAVYLMASVLGKRKDNITTLSFAGIIIVLSNPFVCFNISFILSFSCIFAIFTLAKPIEGIVSKLKFLNESAVSAISISIAVNLALVAITAFFFNEVALIGIISNLFLIPLFSFMFSILFIFAVLGLIWSGLGFGLYLAGILFEIIFYVAGYFALVPPVAIRTALWICVLSFIIIFAISNFSFLKNKVKYIIAGIFVAVFIVSSVLYSLPVNYGTAYIKTAISGTNIISTQNHKNALILENYDKEEMYYALNNLKKAKIYDLDLVIIIEEVNKNAVKDFELFASKNSKLKFVMCSSNQIIKELADRNKNIIVPPLYEKITFFEFGIIPIGENENCYGVLFHNDKFDFLFSTARNNEEVTFLNEVVLTRDIEFVVSERANEKTLKLNTDKLVSYSIDKSASGKTFVTKYDGEFVFK